MHNKSDGQPRVAWSKEKKQALGNILLTQNSLEVKRLAACLILAETSEEGTEAGAFFAADLSPELVALFPRTQDTQWSEGLELFMEGLAREGLLTEE